MLKGKVQLSTFFMLSQYDKIARQRISSMKQGILKIMSCVCIFKPHTKIQIPGCFLCSTLRFSSFHNQPTKILSYGDA